MVQFYFILFLIVNQSIHKGKREHKKFINAKKVINANIIVNIKLMIPFGSPKANELPTIKPDIKLIITVVTSKINSLKIGLDNP